MDGPRPCRLSLVLPAYNEEAGLRQAVAEADDALAALAEDYEILVVDDGSRDGTARLAAELAAERPRVRLLRHETNRGYGAALRTGFEAARFELVAFTDADCQFHLADLADLLPWVATHPVVVGRRLDRQDSRQRRFLSGGYNLLARALLGTGVRDCDCALKVFRREVLAGLLPESSHFFVNTEMLTRARQRGHAVAEVGVRHRPRLHGRSTVSLREVPRTLAALVPFWWTRVVFAGAEAGTPSRKRQTFRRLRLGVPGWLSLALLLAVAGLLFFVRLRAPLLEPQEARYAEIPRQMLAEGRLLVPVLHGQPYLDKPPLLYWLVMASYRLFGVHDTSARLVPGLAGLLTVLLAYLWGRRAVGPRAALCGAAVLCLMPEFVYRQRMLSTDGVLGLWVTAALAAAHLALQGPRLRRGWWALAGVACGLGLLTKGPVALALVAVPVFALGWLDPRHARVAPRAWAGFLALALGLAAPWYVAVAAAMPDFAGYFFWKHNVVRFVQPFDHSKPAWYYLPALLLGLSPWVLLLPGFVRYLARRRLRAAARRPAALGFFLLCFLWGLLFFSAAGSKRPTYLLPALPPLALALGCYLDATIPGVGRPAWRVLWRRGSRLAAHTAALALALGLGLAVAAGGWGMVKPATAATLAGSALLGLALVLAAARRVSWAGGAAAVFAVLLVGVLHLLPAYNRHFALRGHLRRTLAAAHAPARPLSVACYPQRWDSVSFYLPKANVRVYDARQRGELLIDLRANRDTLLLVKSGPTLKGLLAELPAGVEFVTRGQHGAVAVGWVRARDEAPVGVLARR